MHLFIAHPSKIKLKSNPIHNFFIFFFVLRKKQVCFAHICCNWYLREIKWRPIRFLSDMYARISFTSIIRSFSSFASLNPNVHFSSMCLFMYACVCVRVKFVVTKLTNK